MTAQKEKIARFKLSQHRLQGTKSKLNIFEVAHLMDSIKKAEQISNTYSNSSIFNSFGLN